MSAIFTPQVMTLIVVLLFALAAVAIVSFATLKMRRSALELIQRALDKGERLEPHVIERLLGRKPTSRGLLMPGVMTIALGIGVGIAAGLTARDDMTELFKRLGNAAILVCLGIGLIVSSRLDRSDGPK